MSAFTKEYYSSPDESRLNQDWSTGKGSEETTWWTEPSQIRHHIDVWKMAPSVAPALTLLWSRSHSRRERMSRRFSKRGTKARLSTTDPFPWRRLAENYGTYEPRHDKTYKMGVRSAKTQISLDIRPVWSESSLCVQRTAKDPRFLYADSEDSDQTGRMPRLIWVFAGRTLSLLVLSCRG